MNKQTINKMTYMVIRILLFALVLTLGTFTALSVGETAGLASTTLPQTAVEAIAADPADQVIYAGLAKDEQSTQFYISKDSGQSWQAIGPGLDATVTDLAVHPADVNSLYAGTPGGDLETTNNLLVSGDGGQSWHDFHLKLPANPERQLPDVTALAVDPNRPDELYIGTAGQGVYVYDAQPNSYGYELVGGVNFAQRYIKNLVVGPNSQVYALTTEGIIAIDRPNDTWREINSLPDVAVSLAVDSTDPQTLYAGTVGYGAYRSTDGGQTWEALNNKALGWQPGTILQVSALALDEANPQHLAVATAYSVGSEVAGGSVYESHNAGQNWTKLADTETVVNSLNISSGGIYATTAQGLVQYREPVGSTAASPLGNLRSLSNPSGSQILILTLTVILAGLILVGRVEWFLGRRASQPATR